ncbi:hypothetical protein Ga0061062_104245 [Comamonas thiooxydans]|nr:hypothetical protein Ga0061062_104245 [Comamonas thiooxydans]
MHGGLFCACGGAYQVRLTPVSTVPKISTLLEPLELEEAGMVPEQAVSASVAAAAARVSHLRICISLSASIAAYGPW